MEVTKESFLNVKIPKDWEHFLFEIDTFPEIEASGIIQCFRAFREKNYLSRILTHSRSEGVELQVAMDQVGW